MTDPTPPRAMEEARKIVQRHQDGLTGHIAVEDVIHDFASALSERDEVLAKVLDEIDGPGGHKHNIEQLLAQLREREREVARLKLITYPTPLERELRGEVERLREALSDIAATTPNDDRDWLIHYLNGRAREALLTRRPAPEPPSA